MDDELISFEWILIERILVWMDDELIFNIDN